MTPSLQTLFLPLEDGSVPAEGPALFIGAAWHPFLKGLKADVWQPFKPLADTLAGHDVKLLETLPEKGTYNLVLLQVPKQVEEAKFWIASALRVLKTGGRMVMAAANDANGTRLEKWMKDAGIAAQSLSKNKARVVWLQRPAIIPDTIEKWHVQGQKQKIEIGDGISFVSQPGLFGWDKIDAGSKILADHVPGDLKGDGADFGSGNGYLSHRLLQTCPKITSITLAEADSRALDCAKDNLDPVRTAYRWADLSKLADLPKFDFIVMNPPFHTGKKTEASLGQSFIITAAHHLKKNGRLLMVANAHLPYESVLKENFASVRLLFEDKGFKIIEAIR